MNWRNLWERLQSLGFLVFAGIVGLGVILMFVPILHHRYAMQLEIARLDTEIAREEALEKRQRTEIEALKTDPGYAERTARNKLNLARPNEVIFRFEPKPSTTSPPSPH